jgi:hypothetical protein
MRTITLMALLLVTTGFARADEVDPEPPDTLKKLKGTWKAVWIISGGVGGTPTGHSYTFDGEKATSRSAYLVVATVMTVKLDRKRNDSLELLDRDRSRTTKYHFKIEKDKLFLVPDTSNDPKAKPDFTGKMNNVIVYKLEKE